jgi:hypothetical protein
MTPIALADRAKRWLPVERDPSFAIEQPEEEHTRPDGQQIAQVSDHDADGDDQAETESQHYRANQGASDHRRRHAVASRFRSFAALIGGRRDVAPIARGVVVTAAATKMSRSSRNQLAPIGWQRMNSSRVERTLRCFEALRSASEST